ncbi:aminotransferase class IV [Dichotomicrobium thermohalophilum]|uniref:Probable branched-chain-amino-acid aminotransferase n=1 Tax=Dichotomicrobium thermohalophilum TaxID=933063 RepID=A0A397PDJ2_9HYPH|nr:aminotransferase class IV [Dichotomicrobium thermohalophilum]RIA47570.1 branched chain amino acid aminotransferase [Dichotomicrobium thermohalophilum]
MSLPPGVAYLNGEFVPIAEAKISVLDWGFLHSDATYDVVHVWKRRVFRLDAHLDRFWRSAEKLHLTMPVERGKLAEILAECVVRSGLEDAYVEMILTRGISPTFSRDPRDAENQLICFSIPFVWVLPPEKHGTGLSVAVSEVQRIPPESVDPTVKNYHWLDFVTGLYDAYDRGAGSVILQDRSGNLAEGPGFNVFVVKDGTIATPDRGVLEGITRRSAIQIAAKMNIPMEERPVSSTELFAADEAFATSTAGGIIPITQANGAPVGSGHPGPITCTLAKAYWDKHSDPDWSVAVEDFLAETGG